jgi:hypothetical protein
MEVAELRFEEGRGVSSWLMLHRGGVLVDLSEFLLRLLQVILVELDAEA